MKRVDSFANSTRGWLRNRDWADLKTHASPPLYDSDTESDRTQGETDVRHSHRTLRPPGHPTDSTRNRKGEGPHTSLGPVSYRRPQSAGPMPRTQTVSGRTTPVGKIGKTRSRRRRHLPPVTDSRPPTCTTDRETQESPPPGTPPGTTTAGRSDEVRQVLS